MAVTVVALAAVACFCMGASASTPVDIRDVPYHVRVRSLLPNGTHILCGGSILSDRIVLTAAHCTDGKDVSSLTVRAGSADRARGGQELPVARVFQDPRWTEATKDFDVSVLQLEGRITFGDTARPIALVAPLTEQPTGSRGLVAGWGRSSGDGIPSETLGSALLQYIDRLPCRRAFVKGRITPRMVCYGGVVGPACDAVSGAPIVVNGLQTGITSFTRRSTADGRKVDLCASEEPLVFVDVSNPLVQAFIAQAVAEIRA